MLLQSDPMRQFDRLFERVGGSAKPRRVDVRRSDAERQKAITVEST